MRDVLVADALSRALGSLPPRERAHVEVALLFGSRARGDHRSDSDVDVAVLGEVDRLALAAELSRATGHPVEVVNLASAGYPLLSALVEDATLVHEGVPGAYGRWRSHTLSQLDLDRAWYARMRDGYLAKLSERARR
jgi:predicted nucleotidyltransferase